MLDNYKIGNQITLLRKEKGLTGEKLAELLGVSGQAVSKWENGKNLPETALLANLAKILGVSIDTLLLPQELIILNAVYSDGQTHIDVTQPVGKYINSNQLSIIANAQYVGVNIESPRICVLTVKYQTPGGIFYAFAVQNENLTIDLIDLKDLKDLNSKGIPADGNLNIIGAYYGANGRYNNAVENMRHQDYFKWTELKISYTIFPSSPHTDEPEYLTVVYLNADGIHVISGAENEILVYNADRTAISIKDTTACILHGIIPLVFDKMPCTWAGAIYAALKYMGEPYTYEQIYGMSGACFRICFFDKWDWSATDALVTYWYDMHLYNAIGYEQIWANNLEKDERREARGRIVEDILQGKPVAAINLRIAHEWGVITGYKDNGDILYCQTYYDANGNMTGYSGENKDKEYLEADNWPFLICRFGNKKEKPSDLDILYSSLRAFIETFEMRCEGGHFQGEQACEKWIEGLKDDALWDNRSTESDIARRFDVNLWTMFHLVDARRCAAVYLKENISLFTGEKADLLAEMGKKYQEISERMNIIKESVRTGQFGDSWRIKQIELLEWVLSMEKELVQKAKTLLV